MGRKSSETAPPSKTRAREIEGGGCSSSNPLSELEAPDLDLAEFQPWDSSKLDVTAIESELMRLPHLDGNESHRSSVTSRDFREATQAKTAASAIGKLPSPREAIHLVISGRFALWDCVPAVLKLSGCRCSSLMIATLGFSRRNIVALNELLDSKTVARVSLLCSHYFKGTSGDLYTFGAESLATRRQSFISLRTHAKLIAMKLDDGQTITIEASANLRSCGNIEQLTLYGCPKVYAFHVGWTASLIKAAK